MNDDSWKRPGEVRAAPSEPVAEAASRDGATTTWIAEDGTRHFRTSVRAEPGRDKKGRYVEIEGRLRPMTDALREELARLLADMLVNEFKRAKNGETGQESANEKMTAEHPPNQRRGNAKPGAEPIRPTVPARVAAHLSTHRRHAFCDDCIAAPIGLERRQQTQQATSALAATPTFVREWASCPTCGRTKLVIRRK